MNIKTFKTFLIFFIIAFYGCVRSNCYQIYSPDKNISVNFIIDKNGSLWYNLSKNGKLIISNSKLGFKIVNQPDLDKNFILTDTARLQFDETWTQPWGEVKSVRNNYSQMAFHLQENKDLKRKLNIIFRIYNDGIGFRYEFPVQDNLKYFEISDELTEFVMTANHNAWWIKAFHKLSYELLYKKTSLNLIDTVLTPFTIESKDGIYLSIHQASLIDYPSMTLFCKDTTRLTCYLTPWSDGIKVKTSAPSKTPWRTIQIADSPGGLIESHLILNLNEPSEITDCSWIKTIKYIGIWWGMHIKKYDWPMTNKHGATTENAKRYIDFAAKYGFDAVLIEGWNQGWEKWSGYSFTKPYPDYDINWIYNYAASKNIQIIMHNETSGEIYNYESQIDTAYKLYKKLGANYIKTGYSGARVNKKKFHYSQLAVKHNIHVIKKAAESKLMIDMHELVIPSGLQRTWPNMMTGEQARGTEFAAAWNNFDDGNPPEHITILPFTRLLAGPMDYTPGIFEIYTKSLNRNKVNTTIAKQLAYYVIIYSPMQMAADLIENYEGNPAFQFIIDVPVDWEYTKVINAVIGDYITILRKDRNSNDWYLGSITDENAREFEINLSFLENNKKYMAEIYADSENAHWKNNPLAINIYKQEVDNNTSLKIKLAPGGGQAIRFHILE